MGDSVRYFEVSETSQEGQISFEDSDRFFLARGSLGYRQSRLKGRKKTWKTKT